MGNKTDTPWCVPTNLNYNLLIINLLTYDSLQKSSNQRREPSLQRTVVCPPRHQRNVGSRSTVQAHVETQHAFLARRHQRGAGVSDHGAASAAEFKVSENVAGLKLRARATGELSNAKINLEGTLREQNEYSVEGGSTPTTPGGNEGGTGEDDQEESPL